MASFGKFSLIFRRYRIHIIILNFLIFFLFLQASRRLKESNDENRENSNYEHAADDLLSKELRSLRFAFTKWKVCMDEKIDDQRLSLEDMDPADRRYSYLEWYINENVKKAKAAEDLKNENGEDKFEELWSKLSGYATQCRSSSDMWHLEPETVPGTVLHYFLPIQSDTPMTFVRVGIGANVTIEKHFKSRLSPHSEFYGADPAYLENAQIYEDIGTFFPFAVGNQTERKETVLKFAESKPKPKTVNHIAIDTFFKKLVQKTVIDYLFFEGDGGEYDMLSHLAKGGSLDQAGITVCQLNVEYHRPKAKDDPRKKKFLSHIVQFIKDRKYTLLNATQVGDLRVFWINTSSMECNRRFLEKSFENELEAQ